MAVLVRGIGLARIAQMPQPSRRCNDSGLLHRVDMTRSLLVLVLALLAACHPPSLRDRAQAMGEKIGDLGGKVVAVVKPVAPSTDQLKPIATAQATAQLANRLAAQGTISLNKRVDLGSSSSGGTAQPAPDHHATTTTTPLV